MTTRWWEQDQTVGGRRQPSTLNPNWWEQDQEATAPTLGGDNARTSPEDRATAAAERERWSNFPFLQALSARSRHFLSEIPIAGAAINRNDPDINTFREANPIAAGIFGAAAHAAPYMGLGLGAPATLSTLPRAMATGAIIEGTDASARNQPVLPAAGIGAAAAIPSGILSRVISPRSPSAAQASTDARQAQIRAAEEALHRENLAIVEALARERPGSLISRPEEIARLKPQQLPPDRVPPLEIPPHLIPSVPAPTVWNNLAFGGLAGLYGGSTAHALLGAAAPYVASRGANAAVRGANALLRTDMGRRVGNRGFDYFNNQVMTPERRAILNALGLGVTDETVQNTLTGQ